MDIKIKDFTVNGKCSCCGECCSDLLPLSEDEVKRIKEYVQKHGIKEQRHNGMIGVDLTCPFRDEANKKCLIYSIRPEICKQFMCNHTAEDIAKTKFAFGKMRVVLMRNEFFGSKEDVKFMRQLLGGDD